MKQLAEIMKLAKECGLQFGLTDRARLEAFYKSAFSDGQEAIIRLQQMGRDPTDSRHFTDMTPNV